ncbi:MAG TPA: hypothetical protein VJN18_11245 [Polyangiaceae bacterium]|nr:hypothetical protein [Polyangiaceae bacterium]
MALLPPYRSFGTNGAIASTPGCVLGLITGWSASASQRWLQLFDDATPAPGSVPRQSFPVPAGASFSFASSELAPAFGGACFWAVSDTGPTFTQSADSFWVYAEGQS